MNKQAQKLMSTASKMNKNSSYDAYKKIKQKRTKNRTFENTISNLEHHKKKYPQTMETMVKMKKCSVLYK